MLEHYTYTSSEAGEEVKGLERQSQCFWFRAHTIDAAISQAKDRGLGLDEGEALVSEAADAANDLAFSCMFGSSAGFSWHDPDLTAEQARQAFRMTYPAQTQADLYDQTRSTGRLKIESGGFEDAVARYLNVADRPVHLDRLPGAEAADPLYGPQHGDGRPLWHARVVIALCHQAGSFRRWPPLWTPENDRALAAQSLH